MEPPACYESRRIASATLRLPTTCGRCDILVNSAGCTKPVPAADLDGLTDELTDELIDEIMAANFRGVFATIRAFGPLLMESGDGLIVTVSSIAGFTGGGEAGAGGGDQSGVNGAARVCHLASCPSRLSCLRGKGDGA